MCYGPVYITRSEIRKIVSLHLIRSIRFSRKVFEFDRFNLVFMDFDAISLMLLLFSI